jgi:hypothetical protein
MMVFENEKGASIHRSQHTTHSESFPTAGDVAPREIQYRQGPAK